MLQSRSASSTERLDSGTPRYQNIQHDIFTLCLAVIATKRPLRQGGNDQALTALLGRPALAIQTPFHLPLWRISLFVVVPCSFFEALRRACPPSTRSIEIHRICLCLRDRHASRTTNHSSRLGAIHRADGFFWPHVDRALSSPCHCQSTFACLR